MNPILTFAIENEIMNYEFDRTIALLIHESVRNAESNGVELINLHDTYFKLMTYTYFQIIDILRIDSLNSSRLKD